METIYLLFIALLSVINGFFFIHGRTLKKIIEVQQKALDVQDTMLEKIIKDFIDNAEKKMEKGKHGEQ